VPSSSGQAVNSGRGCLILEENELQSFDTSAITENCVVGRLVADVSEVRGAFIFMVKPSFFEIFSGYVITRMFLFVVRIPYI
jgi:hypothetical protein